MGDAGDVMGYDWKRPELSNAPHGMKQDATSIEKKAINLKS